jgi:adenosine deaminase
MELTRKAKDKFEEWLLNQETIGCNYAYLKSIYPSFSWGVVQDWADSLGFELIVEASIEQDKYWYTIYKEDENILDDNFFYTRQEARNAAIKKLNELLQQ